MRRRLRRLQAPPDGPLLGFRGPSAPYWELRGNRPSVALIVPERGPQLLRRRDDGTTWVRFGWERDDVWMALEDRHAIRALDAARRERLSGKELAVALGFKPRYLLTALSQPVDGHCYKLCVGILSKGWTHRRRAGAASSYLRRPLARSSAIAQPNATRRWPRFAFTERNSARHAFWDRGLRDDVVEPADRVRVVAQHEGAVVEALLVAEPLGEPSRPGALLARRAVLAARHDVVQPA